MHPDLAHLDVGGIRLAYRARMGHSPTLMFLPGYASDMDGSKAVALDSFAASRGLAMLRFDYSGTGSSGGDFIAGKLDVWLNEALHLLDTMTQGPVVLVGSSMGGWLALLVARQRPDRIAALVGIAAAPDFTDWGFGQEEKRRLQHDGKLEALDGDGAVVFAMTRSFWESGMTLCLLNDPIAVDCPVRLVHGDADNEVPVEVALRTKQQLRSADVQLTIIKGGGHRLSEPKEIDAILHILASLVELPE